MITAQDNNNNINSPNTGCAVIVISLLFFSWSTSEMAFIVLSWTKNIYSNVKDSL